MQKKLIGSLFVSLFFFSLGCTPKPTTETTNEKTSEKTTEKNTSDSGSEKSTEKNTSDSGSEKHPEKEMISEKKPETISESVTENTRETTPDQVVVPAPQITWAQSFGGKQSDYGRNMAVDSSGNQVIVGLFEDTIQIGTTTLTSKGKFDAFVAKMDSSGKVLWAFSFGTPEDDYGIATAIDKQGNIFVVGVLSGSATIGTVSAAGVGKMDAFIAKFDSNGKSLWAKSLGGIENEFAFDVALDSAGNPVLTGYYEDTITVGTTTLTAETEDSDVFVIKLDSSGTVLWAITLGGAGSNSGRAVAIDSADNVYVMGVYSEELALGALTVDSLSDLNDVFVVKLNKEGSEIWLKSFGSADDDDAYSLKVDSLDNILLAGNFSSTMKVDGTVLNTKGGNDFFVLKLDPSGTTLWAKSFGGKGDESASTMAVDSSGNIYIAGAFENVLTIGSTSLNSVGDGDIMVLKLDTNGNPVWATSLGSSTHESSNGIGVDANGSIYVTGFFKGTVQANATTLVSKGNDDAFYFKLTP